MQVSFAIIEKGENENDFRTNVEKKNNSLT
jgi:hypothetical protein